MNTAGYVLTLTLSLALALLLCIAGWQAGHGRLKILTCWLIVALCGLLVATMGRLIPGGPFVSIHGDFLPVVGCAGVLAIGAIGIRRVAAERRTGLILAMLTSLVLIGVVIANVLSFWNDPFARGALFAW